MITGNQSWAYSGDIPCRRCCYYVIYQSEFINKDFRNIQYEHGSQLGSNQ